MTTTTDYGTWYNHTHSNSNPEGDILDFINGGGSDWCERVDTTGAFDLMARAYRDAIQAALPPGVHLTGDQFIGPAYDDDKDFDGYPENEDGDLDINAIVESVDLAEIVERYDPDTEWTIDEVATRIGAASTGSARKILSNLGVTAVRREPGRGGKSIYNALEILIAQAARPGQGARTDLQDTQ
jgi:hypothetical protein